MRTTVTFSDDVAAAIERRRREQGVGLSEAVNDLVRVGLIADKTPRKRVVLPSYNMGRTLIDYTNVAEAISAADGFDHR